MDLVPTRKAKTGPGATKNGSCDKQPTRTTKAPQRGRKRAYRIKPAQRVHGVLFYTATCRTCNKIWRHDRTGLPLMSLNHTRNHLKAHHVAKHGGSWLHPF